VALTLALARDEPRRIAMGHHARADACDRSWTAVFDGVYASYEQAIALAGRDPGGYGQLVGVAEKQPSSI
jgi:hypothetical protein